jgi:hypothetical protein
MKRLLFAGFLFFLSCIAALPQSGAPRGISACNAASLSVTNSSSNVQLTQCGPSVIVMNLTSQEAFWTVGQSSTTAATTSSYSIPGGAYLVITVPTPQPGSATGGWYFAAITASSTTTIRLIQGNAQ